MDIEKLTLIAIISPLSFAVTWLFQSYTINSENRIANMVANIILIVLTIIFFTAIVLLMLQTSN